MFVVGGCAPTTSLSAYLPASAQEAGALEPLRTILEGVGRRNVDTILAAYADDARIGNPAQILGRGYLLSAALKPVLTKEELRAFYLDEFTKTLVYSVAYYNPQIRVEDRQAVIRVQARFVWVDRLWRGRRITDAANAVFLLRRDSTGWHVLEDRYEYLGHAIF